MPAVSSPMWMCLGLLDSLLAGAGPSQADTLYGGSRGPSSKKRLGPLLAGVVTWAAVATFAPAAMAVPMPDQSYDPAIDATAFIGQGNILDWSQTFTVGLTGTLTSVDVRIFKDSSSVTDALLFDIRTTSGGAPTEADMGANILASVSIAASSVSTTSSLFNVDLTGFGLSVTTGDVLAIALRSDDPVSGAYRWQGTLASGYSDGSAFLRVGGTWGNSGNTRGDLNFRTFVEPTGVPEPSVLFLLGSGLAGLAGSRWRQVYKNRAS